MAENSSQDTQALLQPGIQRFARSISGQPIGLANMLPNRGAIFGYASRTLAERQPRAVAKRGSVGCSSTSWSPQFPVPAISLCRFPLSFDPGFPLRTDPA